MLETLISSKTRLKLLLKFFLNSETRAYLRGLETEFKESATAIRTELKTLEEAGMLRVETEGNRKYFRANTDHPLYDDLHTIILKQVGIDQVLTNVTERLGQLEEVYLTGSFARGIDSPIIDILLVGAIDKVYLINLLEKVERLVHRKIRYLVYDGSDTLCQHFSSGPESLLFLWRNDHNAI